MLTCNSRQIALERLAKANNQRPSTSQMAASLDPSDARREEEIHRAEKQAERDWLATYTHWTQGHLGAGWRPIRVLGRGSFGIVGHWRRGPHGRNDYGRDDIAVKQSKAGRNGIADEAQFLDLFRTDQTPHILQKLHDGVYTDRGHGTAVPNGLDEGNVERIYIEYMAGGELADFTHGTKGESCFDSRGMWREDMLWNLFLCLAKGCQAMDNGQEHPTAGPSADWRRKQLTQICHFDIKPQNIFVGEQETDQEHPLFPISKIADFGLAKFAPGPATLGAPATREAENASRMGQFVRINEFAGTPNCLPPESTSEYLLKMPWQRPAPPPNLAQLPRRDPERLKYRRETAWKPTRPVMGTPSNVWAIGWTMYWMICRYGPGRPVVDELPFKARWTQRLSSPDGWTFGRKMILSNYPESYRYSFALRAAILECLMGEPTLRVSLDELIPRIERFCNMYRNGDFQDIEEPDDVHYFEQAQAPLPPPPPPQAPTPAPGAPAAAAPAAVPEVDLRQTRAGEPGEESHSYLVTVVWSPKQETHYRVTVEDKFTLEEVKFKLWVGKLAGEKRRLTRPDDPLRNVGPGRINFGLDLGAVLQNAQTNVPLSTLDRGSINRIVVRFV